MNYHWIISLFIICHFNAKGQIFQNSGALSTSMSGLNVNNEDIWSVNNNISQLSKIKKQDLLYLIQILTIQEYTVTKMMFCIILEYLPTISKVQELILPQDINLKKG